MAVAAEPEAVAIPVSPTAKNLRMRNERWGAWREAETIRQYWAARLEMESEISRVQSHDLPEGDNHPPHDPNERWEMLANWRQAIVQQLFTPAPDVASVAWKKTALAAGQHKYTDIKTGRIERAIADDAAFIAAHPVRQSKKPVARS